MGSLQTRIHSLEISDENIFVKNYGFDNASRNWQGAGKDPDLLKHLNKKPLKNGVDVQCTFIENLKGNYIGKVEPGKNCLVPRDGKLTYLVSEVEVDQEINGLVAIVALIQTHDEQIWGSEHGLLEIQKN